MKVALRRRSQSNRAKPRAARQQIDHGPGYLRPKDSAVVGRRHQLGSAINLGSAVIFCVRATLSDLVGDT
jgi:hypothetical protein